LEVEMEKHKEERGEMTFDDMEAMRNELHYKVIPCMDDGDAGIVVVLHRRESDRPDVDRVGINTFAFGDVSMLAPLAPDIQERINEIMRPLVMEYLNKITTSDTFLRAIARKLAPEDGDVN
jgi:hypothetical protein